MAGPNRPGILPESAHGVACAPTAEQVGRPSDWPSGRATNRPNDRPNEPLSDPSDGRPVGRSWWLDGRGGGRPNGRTAARADRRLGDQAADGPPTALRLAAGLANAGACCR